MDAEPLPPLDLPTPSDAEMRIDYGDEEPAVDDTMGDEAAAEETLEEAVMGDAEPGDAVVQEEDTIVMDEVEVPIVPEPTAASTPDQETSTRDALAVTESALVEEQQEAIVDESKDEEQPPSTLDDSTATSLPPTTLADSDSFDAAPQSSTLLTAAVESNEAERSAVITGDGEIGADTSAPQEPSSGKHQAQEQLIDEAAPEQSPTAEGEVERPVEEVGEVVEVEQALGEGGEVVESIETTEWTEAGGEVEKEGAGDGAGEELEEQTAIVEAVTEEAGFILPTSRPSLNKSLLSIIELPPTLAVDAVEDPDASSSLTAPTVLLSYQNETYSVFRRHESTDDTEDGLDRSLPVLFEQADKHELYYDQVERFIDSLHGLFPELESGEEELVLELPEIGIALPEDNIYTRQVCLEDLDRVHVGCGLAGRLHLQLSAQPRFASGFNALVDHIANSHGKASDPEAGDDVPLDENAAVDEEIIAQDDGETEDSYVNVEELNDDGTAPPAEEGEGENGAEGGEEHFEDGEWHDEDVVYEGGEGEYDEHQDGEHEHDYEGSGEEVDFEDALADMDSDDLNAVIEGAQEDYVLAEGAVEGSNETGGAEAEVGEEQVGGELAVEDRAEGETVVEGEESGTIETVGAVPEAAVVVEEEEEVTIAPVVEEPTSAPLAASLAVPDTTASDLPAPPIVEISYDTPLRTGEEPPAVPLEQLNAVVDAATKLAPSPLSVSNGVADAEAVKDHDEPEEPVNDVVIDYEDAEEVATTTTLPPPSAKDSPMSPKRGREDPDDEVPALDDESAASDAKRPRLSDLEPESTPVPVSSA
ncbi:hypothetical protein BCR35DRAFT_308159 [Leucosporidium creatinivorum]|uniref:Uncharacterized protein n=1 Tax=Leucosporidium creatinivorum TaxID=106004 RepID=A0A1Y2EEC1_9BASI|nr:hypothetical protein BCR35DRAFT_308159 [Leucosporidium creatinivorum]